MLRIRAAQCRNSSSRTSCIGLNNVSKVRYSFSKRSLTTGFDHAPIAYCRSTSSGRKPLHRLLLAGINPFLPSHLQSSVSPTFTEVPLAEWISSISGRNAGLSKRTSMHEAGIRKEDIEITHVASGLGHAMIGFRDRRTDEEKIFAIGRNESGQLGVGYNSQEPTRGLVEGFQGDKIEDIKCGITSSYIQVRQGDKSVVYVAGNQHRGQLGIPATEIRQLPAQAFLSSATKLEVPGQSVKGMACGYEHLLILTEQGLLLGTGINTDGQLGTGDDIDCRLLSPVKIPATAIQAEISALDAGADTSSFITSNGALYTFGNSEYGQAFHVEKVDRILEPRLVDTTALGKLRVRAFKTAGSSSILLDDAGHAYAAGYGSVGQGSEQLSCIQPVRLDVMQRVQQVHAAYSCAAIVDARQDFYIMGLNTTSGRLGVASSSNAYQLTKLPRLISRRDEGEFEILDVAIGRDTCMVHVVDYGNQ